MTIYEKMKELRLEARKNRDQTTLEHISYFIGEVERQYRNPDDDKVLTLLRSLEKKLDEAGAPELPTLRSFLESSAPRMLSKNEVYNIIESNNMTNIGDAIRYLKANHPNQYSPGEVANYFKK